MFKKSSKKKYELASTSFRVQTKDFFDNSTLHGVRYIAERGRPFCDKFLWWACTSVGATVTLIIIVSLWEKFQTNPTITGLDTDFHNWNVEFPAVSLCQNEPVNESLLETLIQNEYTSIEPQDQLRKYLKLIGSLNKKTLPMMSQYAQYQTFPKTNLLDIAKKIVNRCGDVITDCIWKDESINCRDVFFPLFTENGFCCAFNILPSQGTFSPDGGTLPPFKQEYIYETDIKWALKFTAETIKMNPSEVYIHSSNEQPGLDMDVHLMWNSRIHKLAFSAKTTYTTDDALQLSIKQRRCVFPKEIKLLNDETYTYGGCMRECRIKLFYQKCKCIPYFYNELPKYPLCDTDGLVCLSKISDEIMSKSVCQCELCCDNTVYEVEKLTEAVDESSLELAFVSWPMVRYKREVLFGWVDLLVSFGGIAGLFLGFSLLSGVEIIYYFTVRACCMVVREKETLEKIAEEKKKEVKPPLDLSMTPFFIKKEDKLSSQSQIFNVRPM